MYDLLHKLLTDAFAVILESPRSRVIRSDKFRRCDSHRLIRIYESFETVLAATSDLVQSANYYLENDWPSLVAKRMRKDKLAGGSGRLREKLADLGKMMTGLVRDLQEGMRGSMHYLKGIQSTERGRLFGTPSVAPIFSCAGDDSEEGADCAVLLHVATEAIFKPEYSDRELKKFRDGDPSTSHFIHTVVLDESAAAKPLLQAAEASVAELRNTYSDYREYVRSILTIDDFLA
ncbi:MAG: hypothetical protein HQ581_21625 [Planctomycetes bacterium]|nr:hypothetical protein [Planctomycetota bacterium]